VIGSDLKSRPDDETIGAISDLVIDADGKIVAVIVEVGGFLGLGKKEVAISWDSVEHRMNEKGDEHVTCLLFPGPGDLPARRCRSS
jgi:uncharacterized protein YrrD